MTGKALDVFIHFYLEDISHIDEEQMQFRIDYYMVQVNLDYSDFRLFLE